MNDEWNGKVISMEEILEKAFAVRYIKLHFTIEFIESKTIPVSKPSALRGGIGEMLLRMNCIKDRECQVCEFEKECLVQRTMYSKFSEKPSFITTGDSVGYVIECEDYRNHVNTGDQITFNLLLFGKTIVYFNTYLQAIAALGQNGLGKYEAKFIVRKIANSRGNQILNGNQIYMKYYQIESLKDYVDYREKSLLAEPDSIIFQTGTTIKYQNEFLQEFNMDAIVKAARRRLYILNCFEEIENEELRYLDFEIPEIIDQRVHPVKVRRYSTRQESAMYLRGIKGKIKISKLSKDTLRLLLSAEILHIGKSTSFGFGKLYLK